MCLGISRPLDHTGLPPLGDRQLEQSAQAEAGMSLVECLVTSVLTLTLLALLMATGAQVCSPSTWRQRGPISSYGYISLAAFSTVHWGMRVCHRAGRTIPAFLQKMPSQPLHCQILALDRSQRDTAMSGVALH